MAVRRYPQNKPAARTIATRRASASHPAVGRPITKLPSVPVVRPGNMLGIPERLPGATQPGGAAAPKPSLVAPNVGGALMGPAATATKPPDNPDRSLDSTYFAGVAGLQFKNKNDISDLKLQQGYADADYNTTLRRLATQQAQATQNNREGMNQKGLFYSGQLGKRQGEIDTGYEDQRFDIGKNYTRGSDARTEAIKRIQAGEPLQIAQLRGEADQRYLANTPPPQAPEQTVGLGGLAPQGVLPDGRIITAHKPGSSAPSVTYDAKLGGYWHRYENGRTVFVKKKK